MNLLRLSITMVPLVGLSVSAAAQPTSVAVCGSVKFTGSAPPPQSVSMATEPVCEMHNKGLAYKEDVVVNKNQTLRNVLVYVKDGLPAGSTYAPPGEPVIFDQNGCIFRPHVFGIQVGQVLEIRNSDPTVHNVHTMAKLNQPFNLAMVSEKAAPIKKKFSRPEMGIKIKCDVHPWMSAYAGVFDHPFFGVTGEAGAFELKSLPPGEYTIAAWHEKFGEKTQKVKVDSGSKADMVITYDGTETGQAK